MKPTLRTEQFDLFVAHCKRDPKLRQPRDVYFAFFREKDVPRPVCTVTVWQRRPGGRSQ